MATIILDDGRVLEIPLRHPTTLLPDGRTLELPEDYGLDAVPRMQRRDRRLATAAFVISLASMALSLTTFLSR